MKNLIIILTLLAAFAVQVLGQRTAVSLKQEAWDLADNLSLAAITSADGQNADAVRRVFASAGVNAKNLGITLPELPAKTNDKGNDLATALSYLLKRTGEPIGKILVENLTDEHVAIFEISLKLNLLLLLYAPDGDKDTAVIMSVINQRLERAHLPQSTLDNLNMLVKANADYEAVKNELFAIHKVTSKYIALSEFSDNGEAFYAAKDYAKSVTEFTKALQISPTEPKFFFLRGRSYIKLSKDLEAIADFTNVIAYARSDLERSNLPTAYENRGLCYGLLGKNALAIADLTMALKLRPNHAPTYKLRSLVHKQMGNLKLANADYSMAETLQPGIMR
jgi:tetratricopeptide (TPR) repeat protein